MHRIIGRGLAVIAMASLFFGCGTTPDAAYLNLTWEEFDQDPSGGWRPLADAGDYAGAASMIENYLNHREDLLDAQRGYSTFHAGQLWALHGETDRALGLLDRAAVANMPEEFPRAFNPLVAGTRAFLSKDTDTLRAARDEAAALSNRTEREEQFLGALETLLENEGRAQRIVVRAAFDRTLGRVQTHQIARGCAKLALD